MSEYRKYRGYFIGPGAFGSKEEIDEFIKQNTIKAIKRWCKMFSSERYTPAEKMQIAHEISSREAFLVKECGMDWEEVEMLEF